jgi:peroxiredoxin
MSLMLRRTALVLGGTVLGAVVARKLVQGVASAGGLYPTLDGSQAAGPQDIGTLQPVNPPAPLPALSVQGEQGIVALGGQGGRPIVLNFWATWCRPCVEEMPGLDELAGRMAAQGVDVLAISTDRGGLSVARDFLQRHGLSHLKPLSDAHGEAAQAVGVLGFPTTLVVDAKGRIRGRVEGKFNWPDAGPAILKAVG